MPTTKNSLTNIGIVRIGKTRYAITAVYPRETGTIWIDAKMNSANCEVAPVGVTETRI